MRQLLVLAAVLALAVARPETYREKEDFQYSRSSTDEGSKAGYYGAQRGNMGGNYERAHNMDSLAQNQMSGLVRQVQGELGDGEKQKSGSVYTAANSRGIYGSGRFDLSNLEGRNFQEGVSYDNSQSHSASASQSGYRHNSGFNSGYGSSNAYNSRYRGHHASGNSDQLLYANSQQLSSDDLQAAEHHESQHESHSSGHAQSAFHGQSYNQGSLDSSNVYGSNGNARILSAIPVKVYIRPGTRVAIPVAAQTYDSTSAFDQNAVNSEAEISHNNNQRINYRPSNKPKQYESSYSYRKEWEKHETQPIGTPTLATPTVNPYPKNSELYEDTQALTSALQQVTGGAESQHSSHNSYNVKSASSSNLRHEAEYNAQHRADYNSQSHHAAASNADSSAYSSGLHNSGAATNLHNQVDDLSSKPKSYQSSYSYHKSWERQGDPYVIKPVPTVSDEASQRLTASTSNQGAHQYGSRHHYGTQQRYSNIDPNCDCDENGYVRVARSANYHQQQQDLEQQVQRRSENLEDLDQQTQNKWDNLADLGQQAQTQWDNQELTQQTQNLEDLGQHTQTQWETQDLTQQSQNKWDKMEDLGQQAQTQWDNQELTQQSQSKWDQLQTNLGTEQQTQNTWDTLETAQKEVNEDNEQKLTGQSWNSFNIEQNQEGFFDKPNAINKPHTQNKDSVSLLNSETIWDNTEKEMDVPRETTHSENPIYRPQVWDMFANDNNNNYKPNWQQSVDSQQIYSTNNFGQNNYGSQYHNSNNFYNQWMEGYGHNYHQDQTNHDQTVYNYNMNVHSSSESSPLWPLITNLEPNGNSHTQSSDSSLSTLWGKLDTIEKQSSSDDKNYSQNQHNSNSGFEYNYHHNYNLHNTDEEQQVTFINDKVTSTTVRTTTSTTSSTTTETPTVNNLKENGVFRPQDIGRGDIESDDTLISVTEKPLVVKPFQNKPNPYKTPEEIEVLSLSKITDKPNVDSVKKSIDENDYRVDKLGVLSLDQSKKTEQDSKYNENHHSILLTHLTSITSTTTTTTPKTSYMANANVADDSQQNLEQQFESSDQQVENLFQQNQQFEELGQHKIFDDENREKHLFVSARSSTTTTPKNSYVHDITQKNMEQQLEHDNQQIGSLFQQNKQFEELGQQHKTFDDENREKHLFDFARSSTTTTPKNSYVHDNTQQNMEQQLEHDKQQIESLFQQNQQFEELGQQHKTSDDENRAKHLFDFALTTRSSTTTTPKNSYVYDNTQQNMEQQLEHDKQQIESLFQQNQQFEEFGQQHENFNQNTDQQVFDFGQQSENLGQFEQELGNFEQQSNQELMVQHPVEPEFIQHEQFQHESLPVWNENLNQQEIRNHGQWEVHENLEQQHKNLEQNENLEQQSQHSWDDENLNQQVQTEWKPAKAFSEEYNQNGPENHDQHAMVEIPTVAKKSSDIETPPETEPVTEKIGFWKNVGSKLGSAKDKVASWFKSS